MSTFITAAIEFKLKKQPCTKVEITSEPIENTLITENEVTDYRKYFIEIEQSESQFVTKENEIKSFMKDTIHLINCLAYKIPLNVIKNHEQMQTLINYLKKWGTPQPVEGNKIALSEFIYTCKCAYGYIAFWPYIDTEGTDILANSKIATSLLNWAKKNNPSNKSKELYMLPCIAMHDTKTEKNLLRHPSRYNPTWNCISKERLIGKEQIYNSTIPTFIVRTSTNEIENVINSPDPDFQVLWMRNKVKESLSLFISKQLPVLKPSLTKKGHFIYQAEFHNRILFFLVKKIEMCEKNKVKKCACGCDRLIPANLTYYSTDCGNKVRNNKPGKGLKSLVRSRFNRGHIKEEIKKYLYKKIDTLLREGYEEETIKEIILKEMKEGVENA